MSNLLSPSISSENHSYFTDGNGFMAISSFDKRTILIPFSISEVSYQTVWVTSFCFSYSPDYIYCIECRSGWIKIDGTKNIFKKIQNSNWYNDTYDPKG